MPPPSRCAPAGGAVPFAAGKNTGAGRARPYLAFWQPSSDVCFVSCFHGVGTEMETKGNEREMAWKRSPPRQSEIGKRAGNGDGKGWKQSGLFVGLFVSVGFLSRPCR